MNWSTRPQLPRFGLVSGRIAQCCEKLRPGHPSFCTRGRTQPEFDRTRPNLGTTWRRFGPSVRPTLVEFGPELLNRGPKAAIRNWHELGHIPPHVAENGACFAELGPSSVEMVQCCRASAPIRPRPRPKFAEESDPPPLADFGRSRLRSVRNRHNFGRVRSKVCREAPTIGSVPPRSTELPDGLLRNMAHCSALRTPSCSALRPQMEATLQNTPAPDPQTNADRAGRQRPNPKFGRNFPELNPAQFGCRTLPQI